MPFLPRCKCTQPKINEQQRPNYQNQCVECRWEIEPERFKIAIHSVEERLKVMPPRERLGEKASSMIPQSEEIIHFDECSIRGRNSKDGDYFGRIVITEKNIYLLKNKMKLFGQPEPLTKETMAISQVTGLDQTFESYLTIKSFHIRITRANNEDVLYGLTEASATEIINAINSQMNNQETSNKSVTVNAIDPIEQLTKLAALLEKGFVTQEEFDKKKKELLGL